MTFKIHDTNVLLNHPEIVFEEQKLHLLSTVLDELDQQKRKSFKAREAIRNIFSMSNDVVLIHVGQAKEGESNDDLILSAISNLILNNLSPLLLTDDLAMCIKAKSLSIPFEHYSSTYSSSEKCNNPETFWLDEKEVSDFYSSNSSYSFCSTNPFVVLKAGDAENNENGEVIGAFRRLSTEEYYPINVKNFKESRITTSMFGKIEPKDVYQKIAIESLQKNQMTILTGPPGAAKTLLSMVYIFSALEKGEYSRVVIFTNPVKVKDSADIGCYKGDRIEKLLQQSIGGMLASKIGDPSEVEKLIAENKIIIYPFSDIRGIEIKSDEILYMPEMQNSSIEMAKLGIQRAVDGTKIIIEGDMDTQVDLTQFEGRNNGLRRCIEVLHGKPGVCHIHLPNNYRGAVSNWAEEM